MLDYAEYEDYERVKESIDDCRSVVQALIDRHRSREVVLPMSVVQLLVCMQQNARNAAREVDLLMFQLSIAEEQRQQSLEYMEWNAKNFGRIENPDDVLLPDDSLGY